MFLAGEEFGDVHDMSYTDVNAKQEDPVQWRRASYGVNAQLKANVAKLIRLRTSHPALQRDEIEFFYFHPQFDGNDSPQLVFAYCRTGGKPLGKARARWSSWPIWGRKPLRLTTSRAGRGMVPR